MFFKKILPIMMLASLLVGSFTQPSSAHQRTKSIPKNLIRPSGIITVCASGCNYISIQEAINNAISNDTILLSDETYDETITVTKDLIIQGDGVENTIIQAASGPPPMASSRVITVTSGISVTLEGLTIQHGVANGSGLDGYGGGILNQGHLTIRNSLVVTNTATFGGGVANYSISGQAQLNIENSEIRNNRANSMGGGIYNTAELGLANVELAHSLLHENEAFALGAGIANISGQNNTNSTFTVTHSTLTANESDGIGGGAANQADNEGTARIVFNNSTLSYNGAEDSGGGFYSKEVLGEATAAFTQTTVYGGGLYIQSGTISLAQSIVSGGASADCTNNDGDVINAGYNLVEDGSLSCDLPAGGNPQVWPLADNGGDTPTHALKDNSPALDVVPTGQCSSYLDQRGNPRPFGAGCDIGAFELDRLDVEVEQTVDDTSVIPGQLITYTVDIQSIGAGLTQGKLTIDLPNELSIFGSIEVDPPGAGVVGTPPILAHSMVITANQQVSVLMMAEVSLGLPEGTEIVNTIWFTSTEIITPVVTSTTLHIINAAPIAQDDGGEAYTTTPDQIFTTGNVLDNDSDPNNDELIIIGANTSELRGKITLNSDGTFTYDPDGKFDWVLPGQTAYDTFTYTISDGKGGLNTATVTITIRENYSQIYLPLVTK